MESQESHASVYKGQVVRFQDVAEMRDIVGSMKEVREAPQAMTATDMIPQLLERVDPAGAVAITIEAGSIIALSAHHAHAGVPNHTGLTRISLETRTLMIGDQVARRGADATVPTVTRRPLPDRLVLRPLVRSLPTVHSQ
jgi:hypothetical protein